ncbi:hypothetical protein E2C01_055926 [Portunus trituberculatus]|uniref:Uncharacterized protein n=1 Tax=Portunus trituberculatus TaxID=210409 RepID=A0A5B7GY98_PORTR|nr:hypothetical protein [Portunus trituberculatus]
MQHCASSLLSALHKPPGKGILGDVFPFRNPKGRARASPPLLTTIPPATQHVRMTQRANEGQRRGGFRVPICFALRPLVFPLTVPFKTKFSFPAQPIEQLRLRDVTPGLLPHQAIRRYRGPCLLC